MPVILIDVKGDLQNLLLTFPNLTAEEFAPWIDEGLLARSGQTRGEAAANEASRWKDRLAEWNLGAASVSELHAGIAPRVFTPGMLAGEPLHLLSSLERAGAEWSNDLEAAREALSASISLLLRLVGRDPDPTRSRDHVVLSVFAERRLSNGKPADVASLLEDVRTPPAVIVSVAHLDDDERALVLGIVLDQLLAWVRSLSGTHHLRALLVFDEVYGFIPPHPANPPTKRPLVTLMKQARGFGLGVVLATQNPMDLDYRALSNAGVWCVGRLATDADRERVVNAMSGGGADVDGKELADTLKLLAPRWFVLRNVHQEPSMALLQTRTTLSWLRGPMTRQDLKRALVRDGGE